MEVSHTGMLLNDAQDLLSTGLDIHSSGPEITPLSVGLNGSQVTASSGPYSLGCLAFTLAIIKPVFKTSQSTTLLPTPAPAVLAGAFGPTDQVRLQF